MNKIMKLWPVLVNFRRADFSRSVTSSHPTVSEDEFNLVRGILGDPGAVSRAKGSL